MTLDFKIPSRKETIEAHQKEGGQVAAVFPIHYPRALFEAHGVLPVEVWGPPSADKTLGDAHLQSYTCSIARLGLSYLLAGGLDVADMFVIPHCCDTLQGLGSLVNDFIPQQKAVLTPYLPRERRGIDIEFFSNEVSQLDVKLQNITKTSPTDEARWQAIKADAKATKTMTTLFEKRLTLPFSNREFYNILRAREYLLAHQFVALAEQALASVNEAENDDIPIVLSGVVPEPMELLDALTEMGAVVVADDCLSTGRRFYESSKQQDPLLSIAESIVLGPPDSTRGSLFSDRLALILGLVQRSQAKGVIFLHVKFCEPEQFYLPALRKGLDDANVPSLLVEVDIGDPLPGQVMVRLEAFMEMLS